MATTAQTSTQQRAIHPVDQIPDWPRLAPLALQHVLVMYAGAIAVPLIVGRALKLAPEQVALLVSSALFMCGVVTIIQSLGLPGFGIRLPVMMGMTFAAVSPMLAMITAGEAAKAASVDTLRTIYGSVIAAGIFTILVAPDMSRLLRFFPPVVTGTIILVIGVSLMRIGVNWAAGAPNDTMPGYGDPSHLAIAAFVLLFILALTRLAKGFVSNVAVLLGIVAGAIVAAVVGKMSFAKVATAAWFAPIMPFSFGMPIFEPFAILTMCLVMLVVMVESTGMFLALGDMTGRKVASPEVSRGLTAEGLGTAISGAFNAFPLVSFSQNVGLVGVTGMRSRFVCVAAGSILILLGMIPKLGQLVEAIPTFVLGGAGIVMFGMVAATGIRILATVDFQANRNNLFIVAVSLGFGMIPLVAPKFFQFMPKPFAPLLHSGILLASIAAITLNIIFNNARTE
ncbi:MAG: Uric acid transporter UacT, partial [Pseudomonadota bacterium]